jgi:hypothetical protein
VFRFTVPTYNRGARASAIEDWLVKREAVVPKMEELIF